MGGSAGIGGIVGEITGLGVGLGAEGTTGIGPIEGEVTGLRMGLGSRVVGVGPELVGEVPVPVGPLNRVTPGR